jgi:hypothetical protein
VVMSNAVTFSITVQPWQVAARSTVTLRRATYNRHGRQTWETVRQIDTPAQLLPREMGILVDLVLELECSWRERLGVASLSREAELSAPDDTLGSDGGE